MNKKISFAAFVLGLAALPLLAQTSDDNPRLKKALELFPEADADKDGVLTKAEARAFKKIGAGQGDPGKARPEEESINPESLKPLLELYEAREFEGVKYRLLKPIDLAENPGKKYPMILSLHGAGGSGNDNVRNLRSWNVTMAEEELRRKHPCFVVVPQSVGPWRTPGMAVDYTNENIAKMPREWKVVVAPRISHLQNPRGANLHRVFKLLDAMAEEFPIDTDRVYVLGHSMGGFGTWTAVTQDPDRFAAAIASAGWIGPWVDVTHIKNLPMWAFQGAKDKEIQTSMGNSTFERMQQLGHNLKFTEMANRGHNVSGAAFVYTGDSPVEGGLTKYASDQCDKTADVWDWLFKQKRTAPTVRSEEKPYATKAAENPTASEVPVLRKSRIRGQDGEKRGARLEPTHADVSYGDHLRHKFDLWLPEGKSGPVPVHVYFHGGGFVGGNKTKFDPRPFVNAGFAAVSGSYRLLDGVDTLGPVPMQDGARVIQAIRLNAAEWNIDPERISVSGSSAGAVIAMWIGYHDDLAQPDSEDPIERQSSRVKCIAPINGPTNMDPIWVRANLGGPPEIHPSLPKMFGVSDGFDQPEVRARIQASNPWAMVSSDDPPTLMIYARDIEPMPLAATVGTSHLIHHPQFGVALKEKLDATGVANELHTGIQRRQGTALIVNWLKTQFK